MKRSPLLGMAPLVLSLGLMACNAAGQTGSGSLTGDGSSGVAGQAWLGPNCPVQRENDPACADKPYQASLKLSGMDGREIGRVETDGQGKFRLGLEPGRYTLEATSAALLPRLAPQTVDVSAGQYTSLTLMFDTGIR